MEKYSLSWSDFENNIRIFFGKLRKDQHCFDVSLMSEDGHKMKAHKVILSAGSNFFKEIFADNEDNSLMIFLKGIKGANLNCVLDYIYNGEIEISQGDLNDFLAVANDLKLSGLETQGKLLEESGKEELEDVAMLKENYKDLSVEFYPNEEEVIVDSAPGKMSHPDIVYQEQLYKSENEDLKNQRQAIIKKCEDGKWMCKVCQKISSKLDHAKQHSETHLKGIMKHNCHLCDKSYPTRNNLRVHLSKMHRNR